MGVVKDTVLFSLDKTKYGIASNYFSSAIRAVEITLIPKSPASILGVINLHGKVIPVINIREKLGLPLKPLLLSDQFIILKASDKMFAIVVDEVDGYLNNQEMTLSENISDEIDYVEGVIKVNDEVIAITKVEKLFVKEDEEALNSSHKDILTQ